MCTWSDADWASAEMGRKSVSGGVIQWAGHVVKTRSKAQSLIALSSAESEFYALIKESAETLGIITVLKEWGITAGRIYMGKPPRHRG